MKKVLVLVAKYPSNDGRVPLMYVHVRNNYYLQHGIDVTVLNFSAKEDYIIDGIKVITKESYQRSNSNYDVLISHAANVRNHYFFLKKYEERFPRLIFFFHGHEVLKINEVYPKPYPYMKKGNPVRLKLQDYYDDLKLSLWRNYYPKIAEKSDFVFVSNWFCKEALGYLRLTENDLKGHVHIINNSVGKAFEENYYHYKSQKKYDFITIRSYMDDSKYGVDLVDQLAKRYPEYSFLMIGRGQYYNLHEIPPNVTWVERFLSHEEIMHYIDQSRCGLLLTREDTQGVMTCELAAYGIPVITSDIDVCQEICGDLESVALVENDPGKIDLKNVYQSLLKTEESKSPEQRLEKNDKFSYRNTVKKEEDLILGGGYDFITIRNNLDSPTYCVDLLYQIAVRNSDLRFLLIGRGKFFEHYKKPDNITWIDKYLNHSEMLEFINMSKCALMLTRRDTQGVMACELATYGIPMITSDLPICHEVFDGMPNVRFIKDINEISQDYLKNVIRTSNRAYVRIYTEQNTIAKEIEIINSAEGY